MAQLVSAASLYLEGSWFKSRLEYKTNVMINPREVRIGNWISFKGLWNGQVDDISKHIILIKDNGGIFPVDVFEPIRLIGEHLTLAGFNKYRYWWSHPKCTTFSFEHWDNDGVGLYLHCHDYKLGEYIKYVHQLQNIFFALTNRELEINLESP